VVLAAALLSTLVACRSQGDGARSRGRVRIAAASDLSAALGALTVDFTAAHPNIDVTISYGSSGTFYAQLTNRAPFDIFLSADHAYPTQLIAQGLTVPGSEFAYARGRIVVWTSAESPLDVARDGLQALLSERVAHVAIANPDHAPYGRAAIAALTKDGIYDRVRPKLVFGESVSQAMQFVATGAADAGIVALSLALAPATRDKGRWFEIPESDYPAIEQSGVILKWAEDVDAAQAVRAYIMSAAGQAVLKRYGFLPAGS